MKRFMIFKWNRYYPYGGANDFVTSYDTIEEAFAHPRFNDDLIYGTFQIWDTQNTEIIWESDDDNCDNNYSDWIQKKRDAY